ncbi:MAG: hypothetical protein M3406_09815 [Chloroflexota bacterium]|nr:hypothetical protein [Chloroflexota bacterium]
MDERDEEQNRLIERLLIFIAAAHDRLNAGERDFAREFAEAGEWELALETVVGASRHRLLLTANERQELAEIEASLRRLQPGMRWRSFRDLVRGVLRARVRGLVRRDASRQRRPAVEQTSEPGSRFEPPLLREAMPTVATWLREGLRRDGEELLAEQVDTARIHALCECGADSCFSFYLMPPTPLAERQWTGLMPNGFESIGIDNGRVAWVQDEFRGPIDAVTEDGMRAIREYQALVGAVPRATF